MTSVSFMIRSSSPSILTSVPDHLPNKMRSPGLELDGREFAALVAGAGSNGNDLALLRLLLDGVGNDDAAFRLILAFDAADDDAVVQRTKFHGTRFRSARVNNERRNRLSDSAVRLDLDLYMAIASTRYKRVPKVFHVERSNVLALD